MLYKEEILEHYREPQNYGKPFVFDSTSTQLNPFCGDEIELYIKWDKGGKRDRRDTGIKNISFQGKGCAIAIASASILTEHVKGKTKAELTKMNENDMLNLLGIEVSQTRKKCALLAFAVLQDCLT